MGLKRGLMLALKALQPLHQLPLLPVLVLKLLLQSLHLLVGRRAELFRVLLMLLLQRSAQVRERLLVKLLLRLERMKVLRL
jgi:hypothetical protein